VVHTPRHVRSVAELTPDELGAVASTWHERLAAARDAGFTHPFLFLNEGRAAGASLAHSHSQVAWLRDAPAEVAAEAPNLREGSCALCALLGDDSLEIAVAGDLSLRAAPAGRAPYELLFAPGAHEQRPGKDGLHRALTLLRQATRSLQDVEGPVPLNAWLHAGAHWHVEVVPRLTVLAGLELGAGVYVNPLSPEVAAARLRG
jgi:UDPglucose--hexose-1-phosphate uridylyltransferase